MWLPIPAVGLSFFSCLLTAGIETTTAILLPPCHHLALTFDHPQPYLL